MLQTCEDTYFSNDLQGLFLLSGLTLCAPALSLSLTSHNTASLVFLKCAKLTSTTKPFLEATSSAWDIPSRHLISIAFPDPITCTQAHLHQVESIFIYFLLHVCYVCLHVYISYMSSTCLLHVYISYMF